MPPSRVGQVRFLNESGVRLSKVDCVGADVMKSSRRTLLKILGLTGATLPLMSCERLISSVTQQMGQSIPASLGIAEGQQIDPSFHLLSRAAYGPWPGDLDRVRTMGTEKW